ncbi:hypothetical protein HAX54_041114 [Datura stramonium]|uniref:Uncharacterized protein n=1 Tax=Datura stramonium TaxID=4076 RepID=A0ABS8RP35_DATST|nr:hypothetical protein [Datura stramonium]
MKGISLNGIKKAHLVDRGIDEYKEGMENLLFDLDLMYMLRCLRMKEDWGVANGEVSSSKIRFCELRKWSRTRCRAEAELWRRLGSWDWESSLGLSGHLY